MEPTSPLEFFFVNSAESVLLKANLPAGWRLLRPGTYGFDSWGKLPWKEGCSLRGHLQVYAGRRCGERGKEVPGGPASGDHDLGHYLLRDSVFEIKAALRPEQLDTDEKGRPRLRVMQQPFLRIDRGLYFSFRCWIVFHEPNPAPIADVWEWGQKMFLPGGRPESNRRRF